MMWRTLTGKLPASKYSSIACKTLHMSLALHREVLVQTLALC